MRLCPFCRSGNLKVQHKQMRNDRGWETRYRAAAYVRCKTCNARGPLVVGEMFRPGAGPSREEKEELAKLAMRRWDAEMEDMTDFGLEG